MIFHYLVRGVIIRNGKFLLARQIGAGNTFLPGGHIDQGESAEVALIREIKEEIGKEAIIKGFIGAVEHTWPEDKHDNHEINLLFEVEIEEIDTIEPPESCESHLEFVWAAPSQLKDYCLQPYPLISCLEDWTGSYRAYWGTSISRIRGNNETAINS